VNQLPDQVPFPEPEFVDNPEPRCPCVLLLDTSGSMNDPREISTALSPVQQLLSESVVKQRVRPIDELNAGLAAFRKELMADEMAIKRVEVSLVTFGPIRLVTDFQNPDLFQPPALTAGGDTPIGAAIERAIEMVNARKAAYKQNGVSYYRPWIFMISDGEPTDEWRRAAAMIRAGEQSRSLAFFAVGVEGANFQTLGQLSVRRPLKLNGLRFRAMFLWLSSSLGAVSRSTPGDDVGFKNPTTPDGWASL
jgi:uncharacterized protein YegL